MKKYKYVLEIVECGIRIPRGEIYDSKEEAEEAALKLVDDALPYNYIIIMKIVSSAHFGGDGEPYIRSGVLEVPQVMYACGYEKSPGSFGMFHGPNESLESMLEVWPDEEDQRPCLIRFNLDGTDEVLYRWHKEKWRKVK